MSNNHKGNSADLKGRLQSAIATFGTSAKAKLANPVVFGEPEDQLRAPFEQLLFDLAELCNIPKDKVSAVGEHSISDLKTRPDYAVTVHGALVGFIELKAPGKGADPRKFKDQHDKSQWQNLQSLPNLIYSDGNSYSLWQNGELVDSVVKLDGDIELSGKKLEAPISLLRLFESFLLWKPIPPRNAKDLAHVTARLCRLLRDEVSEQMAKGSTALTSLAVDWRKLLFPEATDERFADGYAQAVTFGLLMARAKGIELSTGLGNVSAELSQTNSLIGAALRLLTDNAENQATLKTSLGTLSRVLDVVDWQSISKGDPEAWLYFYEDFLTIYDNKLRKQTGSYYTPPEVVSAMVRLVDEALRSSRYGQSAGLASPAVTIADPATGTGTYLLGVLRRITETVRSDEGEGAVKGAIAAAIKRLIAFEIQLGPFAVAQLRVLAEIVDITGEPPQEPLRMFVTNTLGNPQDDEGWIPGMLAPIAESRKAANKIKRDVPINIVIGNPPYKERAKGLGGWIESGDENDPEPPPLSHWMPPPEWGVGLHTKHLRNLYVYFWRWATRKVYDFGPGDKTGMVCFITVAGFLNGPGFQKMRDYLRRTCDDIWVIDCTPEGHQPRVNTRIFQGVQQPVCIVLTSRTAKCDPQTPANVYFHSLPDGDRKEKFKELGKLTLSSGQWVECSSGWRAPFLPASKAAWTSYPALGDCFIYNGSGVMPGRTWIIAPDMDSLNMRWNRLINSKDEEKETLFHPHLRNGEVGDKHSKKIVAKGLAGFEPRDTAVADDDRPCISPIRYGFRSFDRQWIIPDNRLINQPNPTLWESRSNRQIFLTALIAHSPSSGPALTLTGHIPDLHHYKGSFGGRVFPLWSDLDSNNSNVKPGLLSFLSKEYGFDVSPEDFVAYIVAAVAHPAYTARFKDDLSTPGIRIPITADKDTFMEAVELGRMVIWLHTFGERMADPAKGRLAQPPRLPDGKRPTIPKGGAIPTDPSSMPDTISYDPAKKRLNVGTGYVDNVEPEVWGYEVSGKQVLMQWFSYRKADRSRPIIGDRRPPSPLNKIQLNHWPAEYTTELINVLNILGWLVEIEPDQAAVLEKICSGPTFSSSELAEKGAFDIPAKAKRKNKKSESPNLFS